MVTVYNTILGRMQQIEFHFKKLIGLMTNDDDIISLREHFIFQKMCSKITEQEFFIVPKA
uniref:Uncharacterized protein n=1 Tax=Rhizophagus irregularis (strain DAOM 181602 / DAOM 197198 / MUCL 43194) TaxID=747089 RepID=U9UQ43_RHIID